MRVRARKVGVRGQPLRRREAVKKPIRKADPVADAMAEDIDKLLFELTKQVLETLVELTKRAKESQSKEDLGVFSTAFSGLADRAFSLLAASDYMSEVPEEG